MPMISAKSLFNFDFVLSFNFTFLQLVYHKYLQISIDQIVDIKQGIGYL